MNKILSTLVLAALSLSLCAASTSSKRGRPRGGNPSGGIVEKKYSGNVIKVVDAQDSFEHTKLAKIVQDARWSSLLPFTIETGVIKSPMNDILIFARSITGLPMTGAAVVIVNEPEIPLRIYTDEGNWAILNIAFLYEDNPSEEVLNARIEKMIWRVLARALQVGSVGNAPSVLRPFKTLKELDANPVMRPSPEGYNAFVDNATVYDIGTISIASYRTACKQGWAPSPTNEIQKAIWNQIHQIPDKPLTIEYDPKKDK